MGRRDRTLPPLEDGPWVGLQDSGFAPPGYYNDAQNVYPLDPQIGEGMVGRPGFTHEAQLGAGFPTNWPQGITEFVYGDSILTKHTVGVAGGEIYTYDWTTHTWTKRISTATLGGAGITVANSNEVAFLVLSGRLFISDGANHPFTWDGLGYLAANLTSLTNCPPLYGAMTAYQGRLFGIKASDHRVAVWSQVDDFNTGYEAGGFTNAWTLTQTDPNALECLVGDNSGISVFRARSSTRVYGDATDLVSTSTIDALDPTKGTRSPHAVLRHRGGLVFFDADMQPQFLQAGAAAATPIWHGFRGWLRSLKEPVPIPMSSKAVFYAPANLILMTMRGSAETYFFQNIILVFDASRDVPVPVGVWYWNLATGAKITALAMVTEAVTGKPVLMHANSIGKTYEHGNPDESVWDDNGAAVEHFFATRELGYSTKGEKIFDRVDVVTGVGGVDSQMTCDLALEVPGPDGVQPISGGVLDGIVITHGDDHHTAIGIDAAGRWVRVTLTHIALGERFGLSALSVTATVSGSDAEAF